MVDQKAMEPLASNKIISVQELLGLNERSKFGTGPLGEFDQLLGFFSPNTGMLKQVPGKLFLQQLENSSVYRIHQTNDSRQNIIIQHENNVWVMSEADFFNRPITTFLTPAPITEEEDMAQAIIAHVVLAPAGTPGGGSSVANTFVQAALTDIISQFNADGTAASFASLTTSTITLADGWYRIRGWCLGSDNAVGTNIFCRLRIHGGAALWAGLKNENSDILTTEVANKNVKMEFGGVYHSVGPTSIDLEVKSTQTLANKGFGNPSAPNGVNDIYRWIEILRTGN